MFLVKIMKKTSLLFFIESAILNVMTCCTITEKLVCDEQGERDLEISFHDLMFCND